MIPRSQVELPADAVDLVVRCLLQRGVLPRIDGAGIHQVLVQEQAEEVVPQVVVRGDVLTASLERVLVQRVEQPSGRLGHASPAAVHRLRPRQLAVDHHDPAQRNQVVAVPVARHVGFRRAHASPERRRAVEPGVSDRQRRAQPRLRLPEGSRFRPIHDPNRTRPDRLELAQEQPSGRPLQDPGVPACLGSLACDRRFSSLVRFPIRYWMQWHIPTRPYQLGVCFSSRS